MSRPLRVASYNVHGCRGFDGRRDVARIVRVLREIEADVIGLQEVESRHGRSDTDQAEEFAAAGVPFEGRGARADHHIEAMRALWTQSRASYHSEYVSFDDVIMFPKPAQQPHPPILVGGVSRVALRRAARLGDGWYGWKLTPEELSECVEILDDELGKVGRRRDEGFRVLLGAPHRAGLVDELQEYADRGVDEFVFGYSLSRERHGEQLAKHAQELGTWLER